MVGLMIFGYYNWMDDRSWWTLFSLLQMKTFGPIALYFLYVFLKQYRVGPETPMTTTRSFATGVALTTILEIMKSAILETRKC